MCHNMNKRKPICSVSCLHKWISTPSTCLETRNTFESSSVAITFKRKTLEFVNVWKNVSTFMQQNYDVSNLKHFIGLCNKVRKCCKVADSYKSTLQRNLQLIAFFFSCNECFPLHSIMCAIISPEGISD